MHHDAVSTDDPTTTAVRGERDRSLWVRFGAFIAFIAFIGLAQYQMGDNRVVDFLSSAMVFTGALMAFPVAVVQALEKSRAS